MEELMLMEHLNKKNYMTPGMSEYDELIEKAFKEGHEQGYQKAMKEFEGYNEKGGRLQLRENFEDKIEKLKEKYK